MVTLPTGLMKLLAMAVAMLAALAVSVSIADARGSTGTTPLDRNLVRNPGAEFGKPPASINDANPVPKWTTTGKFTQLNYGREGYPTKTEAAKINGATQFFTGGYVGGKSSATQVIELSGLESQTDTGSLSATLRVYVATYANQHDYGHALVTFLNKQGKAIGHISTPEVTRTNDKFVPKSVTAAVPKGTRALRVSLLARNTVLAEYIDAYFDNVVVRLHHG